MVGQRLAALSGLLEGCGLLLCNLALDDNLAVRKVLRYEGVSYAGVRDLLVDCLDRGVTLSEARGDTVDEALGRCRAIAEIVESDELQPHEMASSCAEIVEIANPERLAAEFEGDPIKRGAASDEGAASEDQPTLRSNSCRSCAQRVCRRST